MLLYTLCSSSIAEVIIDGSLNGEVAELDGPKYTINADLGQQRGSNLFHSFSRFNLASGQEAIFSSQNDVSNIVARITGGTSSSINGTIESNGANLWMINPAGWMFGADANVKINVGSEFHVSTADSIRFDKGSHFLSNTDSQSELTIDTPIGVSFLKPQKSNIIIDKSNLELSNGSMFSIIAGQVSIKDATIKSPSGQILIGATETISDWNINKDGFYTNNKSGFGRVNITNNNFIPNRDNQVISIRDKTGKNTDTKNGLIQIFSSDSLLKNVKIFADTDADQNAGNINFTSTGDIELTHTTIQANALSVSNGNAGNITIKAGNLKIIEESNISTSTFSSTSTGQSGNIEIIVEQTLSLSGDKTKISSNTNSRSSGGKVSIFAEKGNIYMRDSSVIETTTGGIGNAGDIYIKSHCINLKNNATIGASTNYNSNTRKGGKSGDIIIKSDILSLSGFKTFITSSSTKNGGKGGNIDIDTKQLTINDQAEIKATSENKSLSDAGNISITNTGRINISDAKITTSAEQANGGKITINSQDLILTNGQITTSVKGGTQGNGGDININSDVLVMDTGFIQANTQAGKGNGGNITINPDIQIIASSNNLEVDGKTRRIFKRNAGRSVIQAAADHGNSGIITTTPPQLNISGELTNLKSELVDIDQITQNTCAAPNTKQSTLISLTHGGLPESPEQAGNLTLNPERLTQLLAENNTKEYYPDISGSLITDQPNRERLPPPEYPPQQAPLDFSLPPAQPNVSDTTQNQTLTVKQFRFNGNTVFSNQALQALAASYQQRLITLTDLETLRQQLTQYYVQHGYTHSAALLPEQVFSNGIIDFQIIEGKLTDIRITGTEGLNPDYVQNRLNPKTDAPLNAQVLQQHFQQLLNDPLIERMDVRLLPGDTPEQNILEVEVIRARPYQLSLGINNHSTPGIGAEEVRLDGWVRNLSGFGDLLSLSAGLTEGRLSVDTRFALPLNRYDTLLSLRFAHSQASFIAGSLKQIEIKNEFNSYDLTLTQPVYRSLQHNLNLSARLSVRSSRNQLLGRGFAFEPGEKNNGRSRVSALRLTQAYNYSQPNQIISFRSTVSIGLNLFNATWHNNNQPDGDYIAWLGQLQFARKILDNGAQVRLRGHIQLTPDKLLSMERFALGGAYSVRGYRENEQVTDMGYALSVELHYPLLSERIRDYLPGTLTMIPFMDYGVTWNKDDSQQRTALHSIGIGLNWSYKRLNADCFYAHDLNTQPNRQVYDLQDSGIHFQVALALF